MAVARARRAHAHAAAALVTEGHVRLNGERVSAASRPVKAGDVVTVALDRTVRIMKVIGFAERRGDADAARLLVRGPDTHLSRQRRRSRAAAERDPGSGRPTKQERRAIDRLLGPRLSRRNTSCSGLACVGHCASKRAHFRPEPE